LSGSQEQAEESTDNPKVWALLFPLYQKGPVSQIGSDSRPGSDYRTGKAAEADLLANWLSEILCGRGKRPMSSGAGR